MCGFSPVTYCDGIRRISFIHRQAYRPNMTQREGEHFIKPERTTFRNDPTVATWLTSLHSASKISYEHDLFAVIRLGFNQSGTRFLASAEKGPKDAGRKVKSFLAQTTEKYDGRNAARKKAALMSFLNYHDATLPLSGLKIRRGKPPLTHRDDAKNELQRVTIIGRR